MEFQPYNGEIILDSASEVVTPGNPANNISVRHNNPFNIKGNYWGAIGTGNKGFAIYETPEQGWEAGVNQIKLDQSRNLTLGQFAEKYAPAYENPTWLADVSKMLGVSNDTLISQIPTDRLVNVVAKRESSSYRVPKSGDELEKRMNQVSAGTSAGLVPYEGEILPLTPYEGKVIPTTEPQTKVAGPRQEFISEEKEPGRTRAESISAAPEQSLGQKIAETVSPYVRPILEIGGLASGGVVGTAGEPGVGTLVGAGLGYGLGKKAADALDTYAGIAPVPTMKESLIQSAKDVGTGAAMEAGGQVGGVVVPKVISAAGKLGRTFAGKMAGTGSEVAKDALESGKSTGLPFMHPVENIKAGKSLNPLASATNFDKALRGEIKGKEIIDSFKGALDQIAETRRTEYLDALGKIPNQRIDIAPMKQKVLDLLVGKRPGEGFVRTDASGALDWSRSSLGGENTEGVRRIRDAAEMVANWGSKPGDDTILGLDMLKRHIDGLYGETSQAKAFITQLRNTVKKTITDAVPEYGKLTKKYQEASGLINDVEGLIGRKASSGMIGNIVADQSLRRLMSAMRNDRELQKEVIDVLGKTAGEDLSGLVSGFSMKTGLPVGLAGTGPTLLGEIALAHYVNPAFWPVLAASSPRLQGEFLRMYGQVLAETKGMSLPVSKIMSYLAMRKQELKKSPKESENAQE